MKGFVSCSQIGQDTFVYEQLVKPHNNFSGTFLDIGCSDGISMNNTIALERLGWRGLLVDIDPEAIRKCGVNRTSPAVLADATTMNWSTICGEHRLGKSIDYLSLDIDDAHLLPDLQNRESWRAANHRWNALVFWVLSSLLLSGFSFRAITCEHNSGLNQEGADAQRELLKANNYRLFAEVNKQDDFWLR